MVSPFMMMSLHWDDSIMRQAAQRPLTCIKQIDVRNCRTLRARLARTRDDRRLCVPRNRRLDTGVGGSHLLMQVMDSPEARLQAMHAIHLFIRISR
jgi:hypothetical protein